MLFPLNSNGKLLIPIVAPSDDSLSSNKLKKKTRHNGMLIIHSLTHQSVISAGLVSPLLSKRLRAVAPIADP